jgi:hypothetical protein
MDSADDAEEGDESEKPHKKKRSNSEEAVKPRPLHRTASIFLRNLAPTITKQEVEAVRKKILFQNLVECFPCIFVRLTIIISNKCT